MKSKNNKNFFIILSVVILVVLVLLVYFFIIRDESKTLENEIDKIQSNLGQSQAEKLAIDANQDWVVDLQPDYNIEIVSSSFKEGVWTISLKLWIDKTTAPLQDQKGFILEYNVNDLTGDVEKNPKRTNLN